MVLGNFMLGFNPENQRTYCDHLQPTSADVNEGMLKAVRDDFILFFTHLVELYLIAVAFKIFNLHFRLRKK